MRRLYVLLAVWCVLLVGPAVLVQSGVFGPFDINSTIHGQVVGVWLVGYLAQFAIFMWIARIAGDQHIVWWLLASLLPWAIDWTLPVSSSFIWLWTAIVLALCGWIATAAGRIYAIREHGVRATGVVLEVIKPLMNVVVNNVYIKRKVRLRIEREDGAPSYESTWKGLFMLGEIPSPGDRIPLLVDPAHPTRFEYDERSTAPRSISSSPRPRTSDHSNEGISDELERLARLRDRGVLTNAEFDAAKKKLLGS